MFPRQTNRTDFLPEFFDAIVFTDMNLISNYVFFYLSEENRYIKVGQDNVKVKDKVKDRAERRERSSFHSQQTRFFLQNTKTKITHDFYCKSNSKILIGIFRKSVN